MISRPSIREWMRATARGLATGPAHRDAATRVSGPRDLRSDSARDRDTRTIDRLPAEMRHDVVRGRAALAALSHSTHQDDLLRENGPVACLLALLWHPDADVRRAAAHALPGGDHAQAHIPHYGHFVGAFLRGLSDINARYEDALPATPAARYERVTLALRALLDQNIGEIRGMSNMNYSFLSSALYLAVLATCRDVVFALRRLRAASAEADLCRLLWNLSQISVLRRFNGQDLETLANAAGAALAALPPDYIPDFWHSLSHAQVPRRLAVSPSLNHFQDRRAVPYLLDALAVPGAQPSAIAQRLAACLGRLEDARALSVLDALMRSSDRQLRDQARAAIRQIQRAVHKHPSRTLLRATMDADEWDSETMLRPAPVNTHISEPAGELLRPPE
jgi:hypothetical protein